jgi:hypothetical protein
MLRQASTLSSTEKKIRAGYRTARVINSSAKRGTYKAVVVNLSTISLMKEERGTYELPEVANI